MISISQCARVDYSESQRWDVSGFRDNPSSAAAVVSRAASCASQAPIVAAFGAPRCPGQATPIAGATRFASPVASCRADGRRPAHGRGACANAVAATNPPLRAHQTIPVIVKASKVMVVSPVWSSSTALAVLPVAREPRLLWRCLPRDMPMDGDHLPGEQLH